MSLGELLTGDGVTQGIVRIGDTVRRPLRRFSLTDMARRYHEDSRASAELDPVFRKLWEDGAPAAGVPRHMRSACSPGGHSPSWDWPGWS